MTAELWAQAEQVNPFAAPAPAAPTAADAVHDAAALLAAARGCAESASGEWHLLGLAEATEAASLVEDLSRVTGYLQLLLAGAIDRHRPAETLGTPVGLSGSGALGSGNTGSGALGPGNTGSGNADTEDGSVESAAGGWPSLPLRGRSRKFREFRSTADYLRARLRISRAEAKRRLNLTAAILPGNSITRQPVPPSFPLLTDTCSQGVLSVSGAELILQSLEQAESRLEADALATMEKQLTAVGAAQDHDFLIRTAQHWLALLDQETPPNEKELTQFQGVFPGRRRNGLHHLHIYCTGEQHEVLTTAMNSGANPRLNPPAPLLPVPSGRLPKPTRPQQLLNGLLGAVRAGLASGGVPAAGGLRPQVMVTISHDVLLAGIATLCRTRADTPSAGNSVDGTNPPDGPRARYAGHSPSPGTAAFSGPIPLEEVRRLACDADLLPAVLGTSGQVLELGRSARLFPPHLRKALHARDRGCTFPGCTIPGPWTEAHHVTFWEHGGGTGIGNGALLCSFHHHLIHEGNWQETMQSGIPWFRPPAYVDPERRLLRNTYFHPG